MKVFTSREWRVLDGVDEEKATDVARRALKEKADKERKPFKDGDGTVRSFHPEMSQKRCWSSLIRF